MTHSSIARTTADPTVIRPLEPTPKHSVAAVALGAFGMVVIVGLFALCLHILAQHSPRVGPVYAGWPEAVMDSPMAGFRWFLGDMTEPLFFASDLAALGLLAGAALAWFAGRRRKGWAGSLTYGTGLWPWVLASASLSLLLSNLAFGWMLDDGWQPTFVPFVCVAPAMVLVYGPGWKTCLTAAILGASTTTPLALLLIPIVSTPFGLPVVVANVLAMSVGSVVSFIVARQLPWLALREPHQPAREDQPPSGANLTFRNDALWAARRILKDFTETHFFANELASIGVILGVAAAFVLNPGLPSYGSNLLPHILFAQALTSAIGVVLWQRWYRGGGWAATYASVVSVAPAAVLAYGGSWSAIVGGAVLGAILAPPIARAVSARLPAGFHPVIGNTAAMAVSTAAALPLLGLLPH
ncbi:hypothetical protein LN996_19785 [Arthrobacter sp. AK01]|uniref:hypothetical protein n=1 Tax=Arthrobacter sp. AK01 TaxID=2894084 RepID=UPI001E4706C6|nr:hypothetical protein [Arthrobacter sp. AK01]MCD4853065.1 hypothetical protein [Arthrobacter sp. AK01]